MTEQGQGSPGSLAGTQTREPGGTSRLGPGRGRREEVNNVQKILEGKRQRSPGRGGGQRAGGGEGKGNWNEMRETVRVAALSVGVLDFNSFRIFLWFLNLPKCTWTVKGNETFPCARSTGVSSREALGSGWHLGSGLTAWGRRQPGALTSGPGGPSSPRYPFGPTGPASPCREMTPPLGPRCPMAALWPQTPPLLACLSGSRLWVP